MRERASRSASDWHDEGRRHAPRAPRQEMRRSEEQEDESGSGRSLLGWGLLLGAG